MPFLSDACQDFFSSFSELFALVFDHIMFFSIVLSRLTCAESLARGAKGPCALYSAQARLDMVVLTWSRVSRSMWVVNAVFLRKKFVHHNKCLNMVSVFWLED